MRIPLLVLCAVIPLAAQTLENAEALWKQRRYNEANDAFRALVKANPKDPDYKTRWGRLLLERFNLRIFQRDALLLLVLQIMTFFAQVLVHLLRLLVRHELVHVGADRLKLGLFQDRFA